MVATSVSSISGSGTAEPNIKASVGDVIRWTDVSESGRFDTSVVIYGGYVYTDQIFKSFSKRSTTPNK